MRTQLIALAAFGLVYVQTQAEQTNVLLQGGLFAGPTIHNAQFTQLPGVPNCCVEFDGGSGFGFGAGLGVELDTRSEIFDGTLRLGVNLSYQALPGTLTQDEVVGNIINGTTVTDGVVEHTVDLSYGLVALQPYVAVPLIDRLFVTGGLTVGMPLAATYEQQQTLVEPSDPDYTFENGTRTRAQQSGDLPDKASIFAALAIGARYDIALSDALTVAPSVTYQLGLTDIVSTVPWKVNAIFGGVTVQYRLPKPAPAVIEVAPPPPPPPPPPPVVVVKKVASEVTLESPVRVVRRTEDSLFVNAISVEAFDTVYQAAPTIYFAQNSTNLVDGSSVTSQMQQRILASVQRQLATRKGARITIEGMTSRDEEARLARERVSWVLRSLNTDPNLTTVVTSVGDSVTHPELADEQRRVRILIDGEPQVLEVHSTSSVQRFTPIELTAVHVVTCEAGPCTESIQATANSRTLDKVSGRTLPTFTLNESDMSGSPLRSIVRIDASLTDSLGQTARSSATKVVVALEQVHIVTRVRAAHGGIVPMNELTLGFCDFDKTTMSAIDRSVIDQVREAIKRGARITIIPSTDGFGSSEYNDKLQRRRAAEAMNVLGVLPSQVDVELTPVPKAIATTPMERIEQRSIRVRITDVRP